MSKFGGGPVARGPLPAALQGDADHVKRDENDDGNADKDQNAHGRLHEQGKVAKARNAAGAKPHDVAHGNDAVIRVVGVTLGNKARDATVLRTLHRNDAVRDKHFARVICNDLTFLKGLLFFALQKINKDERAFIETVIRVPAHRARGNGKRRDPEDIGRDVVMQAAFDDQREIDDENGDKQHRQHDEYDRCDKTAAISLCRLRRLLRVILLHGLAPQRKSMDAPLFPSQYCAKTIAKIL